MIWVYKLSIDLLFMAHIQPSKFQFFQTGSLTLGLLAPCVSSLKLVFLDSIYFEWGQCKAPLKMLLPPPPPQKKKKKEEERMHIHKEIDSNYP